jgi:hypothetical protein
MPDSKARDECVGTLLVHQQDMLDLSGSGSSRVTREAVGTLLVPQSDMKELSAHEAKADANDDTEEPKVTLMRRITKTMTGPPPDDDSADIWAD